MSDTWTSCDLLYEAEASIVNPSPPWPGAVTIEFAYGRHSYSMTLTAEDAASLSSFIGALAHIVDTENHRAFAGKHG